jgi:RNA polymerase sigma factor (sigma-70 family)
MSATSTFAELYAIYFPAATGFARGLSRDQAIAEDIAAESLLRVWRHWESGAVAQPWGYIRRTVLNETISRARRAARDEALTARYEYRSQAVPVPSPERGIVDRDLVARLLDRLPPQQRRIVQLRFLEDLSEKEAALRLGISVGAVKSGKSRALARLRSDPVAGAAALAA